MANFMKARQTKYGAYVAIYTLIVLAVLVAANFLANRHNESWDFTKNKRFSLADQTTKVVSNLKQDVHIRYFDKGSQFPQARDLLDRYDNLSPRLKVDYVDPDRKPELAQAAKVQNYGSIYIESGEKKEEAKALTEEEVTSALIRVLKEGVRTVCSVRGSGEHTFDSADRDGYSAVKDLLERNNYRTQSISLLESQQIPPECTILLIPGPKLEYPDLVLAPIREFVEKGGRALFMVDPPLESAQFSIPENPGLVNLLASWGVTPQKNLIYETSPVGTLFGFGQLSPLVTTYDTHPIVRDMRETATAFPLSRSLDVSSGKDKTSAEKLFSSLESSRATTNLKLSEDSLNQDKDPQGPFVLGAAGTYDTGNKDNEGRFVVVGSSSWLTNNIPRQVANHDLFLNMINWLSSDEDLISIRPKDPEDTRLAMTAAQVNRVLYVSVLFIPLAVIFAGVFVWFRRR